MAGSSLAVLDEEKADGRGVEDLCRQKTLTVSLEIAGFGKKVDRRERTRGSAGDVNHMMQCGLCAEVKLG